MYNHIMWLSNFFQEVGLWLETLLWHVTVKQLCERTPKHDRSSWQALGSWKVVIQSLTGVCSPTWKHLKVKTNEWGFRFCPLSLNSPNIFHLTRCTIHSPFYLAGFFGRFSFFASEHLNIVWWNTIKKIKKLNQFGRKIFGSFRAFILFTTAILFIIRYQTIPDILHQEIPRTCIPHDNPGYSERSSIPKLLDREIGFMVGNTTWLRGRC